MIYFSDYSHVNVFELLHFVVAFEVIIEQLSNAIVHGRFEFDKSQHGLFACLVILSFEKAFGYDHINIGTEKTKRFQMQLPKYILFLNRTYMNCLAALISSKSQVFSSVVGGSGSLGP